MELQLLKLNTAKRLEDALNFALSGVHHAELASLSDIKPGPLLFAAHIDEAGGNRPLHELIHDLRQNEHKLDGVTAGIIIDGDGELYTKSTAAALALSANFCGCAFIGKPLVEATGSLNNFLKPAHLAQTTPDQAYNHAAADLVQRLIGFNPFPRPIRSILTLYASSRAKSNTYALYSMVKQALPSSISFNEIMLRNGAVADCEGCEYTTCRHLGEHGKCFYGGVIVKDVLPALCKADSLLLLCPNYNDAADANITAFINRLTGLYYNMKFFDKRLYSIIVSGYSGGDIVASQLLGALNFNKSFHLPPRFALLETANDPGAILTLDGISHRALAFADRICGG